MAKTYSAKIELTGDHSVKCIARDHTIILDEEEGMGGENKGMNPIEALLSSLGACQIAVAQIYAKNKGVNFQSLRMTLEGDVEQVAIGSDQRPDIVSLRLRIYIKSTDDETKIRDFCQFIEDNFLVANFLKNSSQMIPEVFIEK